jgi:phenylalanyl-tRNA synthetase beta chain
MGGASTEISGATTSVLLEPASWDPMTIARTSKRLNLRSEASARFERGVDPEIAERAAARFAELLALFGAVRTPDVVDERGDLAGSPTVRVRTTRVNGILGTTLTGDDIAGLLRPIGFAVEPTDDADAQLVTVASFRPDTETEIDVIEEIARHFGYSNIPRTRPPAPRSGSLSAHQLDRRTVRQAMVGLGLDEAMPLAFLAPDELAKAGVGGPAITLSNPLTADESVLRTSLRPGLLKSVAYNVSRRQPVVGLFEIGHVFRPPPGGQDLPDEREMLGVIRSGRDAFAAAEAWQVLLAALGVRGGRLVQGEVQGLHPARAAEVFVGDAHVGALGEIDPAVCASYEIPGRVAWLEVDLGRLLAIPHGTQVYEHVSRFPSSDIDLAFAVAEEVPAAAVRSTIERAGGPTLASVHLFDVFRGDGVGEGRRSLAFRLRFQAPDHTLTDDEVAAMRADVIDAVETTHAASLRG